MTGHLDWAPFFMRQTRFLDRITINPPVVALRKNSNSEYYNIFSFRWQLRRSVPHFILPEMDEYVICVAQERRNGITKSLTFLISFSSELNFPSGFQACLIYAYTIKLLNFSFCLLIIGTLSSITLHLHWNHLIFYGKRWTLAPSDVFHFNRVTWR